PRDYRMRNFHSIFLLRASLVAFLLLQAGNGSLPTSRGLTEEKSGTSVTADDKLPEGAFRRIKIKFGKTRYDEEAGVIAIAWSPDGKMVACRCSDNTARIFSMPDGKEVLQLRLCPLEEGNWDQLASGIRPLLFSPDGRLLATAWPAGTAAK